MTEINRRMNIQFDEYRDCLRLVWNYSLRHRLKGPLSLPDVSQSLLDAVVLDDLSNATPTNTTRTQGGTLQSSAFGYVPALGVQIAVAQPLILKYNESGGEIAWQLIVPDADAQGSTLYYVDVFDFKNADEMFDFEYVKAVPRGTFNRLASDDLVLLRRSEVDIVDLTSTCHER